MYSGPFLLNNLPLSLRNISNVNFFKYEIADHLLKLNTDNFIMFIFITFLYQVIIIIDFYTNVCHVYVCIFVYAFLRWEPQGRLVEGGKGFFSCNMFCHFYFMCSHEKGLLFTAFREIGKKINVQIIFNCSFIMKWQFYFAFFCADTPTFTPLLLNS